MNVHRYIYEDPPETVAACCRKILDLLKETLANQDLATLAVSGGSTPKLLFAEMAKSGFDWTRAHLFWVDQRSVPRNCMRTRFVVSSRSDRESFRASILFIRAWGRTRTRPAFFPASR